MKKIIILILLVGLFFSGCGWFKKGVKKSSGITKQESRLIAMEYMAGAQPTGFINTPTAYGWDFRIRRDGKESITTVLVDKKSGSVESGIE